MNAYPQHQSNPASGSFRGVLSLCLGYRGYLLSGTLALLGGVATNLIFPGLARSIVDQMSSEETVSIPSTVWMSVILLLAVQGFMFFYRTFAFGVLGQLVTRDLQHRVFTHLLALPVTISQKTPPSDLINRLHSDTLLIRDAIGTRLSVVLRYSIQVIAGLLCMVIVSPILTIGLLGSVIAFIGVSALLGRTLKSYSISQQKDLALATEIASEALENIAEIKLFQLENYEINRYFKILDTITTTGKKRSRVSALFQSLMPFILNILLIGFVIIGLTFVAKATLTPGLLLQFALYGAIVASSLSFIATSYGSFVQSYAALDRLNEVLEATPEVGVTITGQAGSLSLESSSGRKVAGIRVNETEINETKVNGMEVECSHLYYLPNTNQSALQASSFGSLERYQLQDISLTIKSGQFCAIIGASGSGKTTLAQVLLTLFPPTSGSIMFDGEQPSPHNLSLIRSQIGYVAQSPGIFSTSLIENLRGSDTSISYETAWEAIKQVRLEELVISLPKQLDTPLGAGRYVLSGGERQRLAIARALLKSPRLLVLDEATAALDATNEKGIIEVLNSLRTQVTIVLIAHRLSSIKSADMLVVMENGKIIEYGSPSELLKEQGRYYEFLREQQ